MSFVEEDGTQHPETDVDLVHLGPPGEPLSPFLLLYHYAAGIFPFLMRDDRHCWWSFEPRAVFFTRNIHVSRSLRRVLRRETFSVTADTCFDAVVEFCRLTRTGEGLPGSWLNDEYVGVFRALHQLGHAHSVEVWDRDQLVGGLFGVAIGQMFYGCSMFHLKPDASKVALVRLAEHLAQWHFPLIDCQIHNPHLRRMGAHLIPRMRFHEVVRRLVRGKRHTGRWTSFFK